MIKEYYRIAPNLVGAIDASSNKEKSYAKIYTVIMQCLALIDQRRFDEVVEVYKRMVLDLQKEYKVE